MNLVLSIKPDALYVAIGLSITLLLGMGVGCLVDRVGKNLPLPAPSTDPRIVALWDKFTKQSTGGFWIGWMERPIFFAAFWLGAWWLLSSWLVFKLAFYWQNTNFAAFPEKSPDGEQLEYLVAKRHLGAHHVATALVGTGANILLALVGVAVAKWIKLG